MNKLAKRLLPLPLLMTSFVLFFLPAEVKHLFWVGSGDVYQSKYFLFVFPIICLIAGKLMCYLDHQHPVITLTFILLMVGVNDWLLYHAFLSNQQVGTFIYQSQLGLILIAVLLVLLGWWLPHLPMLTSWRIKNGWSLAHYTILKESQKYAGKGLVLVGLAFLVLGALPLKPIISWGLLLLALSLLTIGVGVFALSLYRRIIRERSRT